PSISFKFVCIGNSVEIFQNVTYTFSKSEYTLYRRFASDSETIALWAINNFSTNTIIIPEYQNRLFLQNGTILLQDFQASDEATYTMLYQNEPILEVQLCAFVSRNSSCTVNMTRTGNILNAYLDHPEQCGRPLVTVRWMEYPGVSYL
ncbi:hypothetical protein ACJMK2_025694, partial [Sinanodonta woodiana]